MCRAKPDTTFYKPDEFNQFVREQRSIFLNGNEMGEEEKKPRLEIEIIGGNNARDCE